MGAALDFPSTHELCKALDSHWLFSLAVNSYCWMLFTMGINIAVIYLVVSAYTKASLVNDTFINVDLGTLRLPVYAESPPKL